MALTGLLISTHLERGHVASVDSSADTDLNISVLLWSVTGGAGAHFHFHSGHLVHTVHTVHTVLYNLLTGVKYQPEKKNNYWFLKKIQQIIHI